MSRGFCPILSWFLNMVLVKGLTSIFLQVNILFSQHHLLKRLSFPIEWSWCYCQKEFVCVCEHLFLASQVYSIGLFLCQYYIFMMSCAVSFWNQKCKSSIFVLFQGCFGYSWSLWVEKAMAPHSSILAWKIPWTEEPGRLQTMGSRRVGHDWATSLSLFPFTHWRGKWQPTPVFLPGESQGRGSLVGYCLWGRTESDTTEVT